MVLDNLDSLCDRVKEAFDTTQAGATERAWFNGRINALRLDEGRVSEEDNGESQVAQDLATVTLEGLSLDELKQAVEDARWSADNLDENHTGVLGRFPHPKLPAAGARHPRIPAPQNAPAETQQNRCNPTGAHNRERQSETVNVTQFSTDGFV